MNRDRTVIGVLVVLLLASLAMNWRLWNKTRSAAPVAAADATAKPRPAETRESGEAAKYDIAANPEMKGRLGRIVMEFAGDMKLEGHATRVVVYASGKNETLTTQYNSVVAELPPGKYDLEVAGKKIAGVPVESGKDTRVRSGVLRTHASDQTRFTISDVGSADSFHVMYGNATLGLPVGDYEITVNNQREKFTIEAGKVTEF